MKQTMKNILLVSDIDGTICPEFGTIPQRNIDAVRRFKALGGHFTLATGRNLTLVKELIEHFDITDPLILVNGSCIYDINTQTYTHNEYLPSTAEAHLTELMQHPKLALIRLLTADEQMYTIYASDASEPDSNEYTKLYITKKTMSELRGVKWRKALLIFEPEDGGEFKRFVDNKNYTDVEFISSSAFYYEMMPMGASKGNGLKMVAEQLGMDIQNTVAIGDYDNDLSMINAAGLGVATANAVELIKEAAQLTVCHSRDGSLGDLVEHLEKNIAGN